MIAADLRKRRLKSHGTWHLDEVYLKIDTPEAMDTLKEAMADHKAPWSARIAAAIAALDRGWGKPTQALDANLSFFDDLTDHERQALLAVLEAVQVNEQSVSKTEAACRCRSRTRSDAGLRPECANCGHSPTDWRTGKRP